MTTKVIPGKLVTLREASSVGREAAKHIADTLRAAIEKRARASIALSGGNTPRDAYALLASEPGINWTRVHIFWVDERAVPPSDDRSNYRWAKATLVDGARVPAENVHRMVAEAADLEAAARDYEQIIRGEVPADGAGVPAFDVLVLGVGDDGHTASLFPGESTVDITGRLVATAAARTGREARMTLTAPMIEHGCEVVVLAVGAAKHPPLERIWNVKGDVHQTPARILRSCRGELIWFVDRAAAGLD
jgi:6-phosphogluconolactonase